MERPDAHLTDQIPGEKPDVRLIDKLSEPMETLLSQRAPQHDVVIAVSADLNPQGQFDEEWLVVTDHDLIVYEPNGGTPSPRFRAPLKHLAAPRQDSLIGGSALIADVDGMPIEIIRYSNAHGRKFGRVAKYLADVVKHLETIEKGEETKENPRLEEDTEEEKRCPTCNLLLQEGTRVCPACLDKRKVLIRLMGYLRPYWKVTAVVWTLMLLGVVLGLVNPYLTRPLMDVVLAPKAGHIAPLAYRERLLGWLVVAMFASTVLSQVFGILQGRAVAWLGSRLSHDLRTELYQRLQLMSLKYFDKRQTGALMARVSQDTESLQQVLVDGAQFFVVNILQLIAITIILFVMNWRLTLLVMIPAPAVYLLSKYFWPRMFSMWHRFWYYRQRLSATLNDSLSGIRVVKAFAQEGQEIARFNQRSDDLRGANLAAEYLFSTYWPIISLVMGLGSLFVWYAGGTEILSHPDKVSLGVLMAFMAYLGMFYGPMQFLSRIADWMARSMASAERVFEVLDAEPDVAESEEPVRMPLVEGHVEFRNATFGYDRHKPVLKNISFDIKPGEMIGFVGHSGAGKSTTINLICRFYDLQTGQLLIDGVDIKRIRQEDLRSQIGVVLQDTFLFNGTILENISYARPDASKEEIMAAAKAAHAHDFIVKKPDGYDTVVGERGQALSGGERQRISIARAILHNPRILILDEATSSVDTDTEKQIQDAIARLVKGRTTFAIAHRLSTLRNADRLVVLKEGKVEEMGTHDELLEKKGEFFRLVEMQQEMSRIKAVAR